MISCCPHTVLGLNADRVFAHKGTVLAIFCKRCEPDFKAYDLQLNALPQFWQRISEQRAETLGLPVTVPNQDEASVFGQD